jgi:hypothetical protein
MKRCACREHDGPNPLPETEFYRDRTAPAGLTSYCKECAKRSDRRWRETNPEKIREINRKAYARYRDANPEKIRQRASRYAQAHPEKARQASQRWRKAHPEKARQANQRWREAHPEEVKEAKRRRMARGNAVTLDNARHHREVWTGPQLEIAAREDLTAKQIAAMTGRTMHAVYYMRRRLRDDPKIIWLAGLDDPADAMARPGASFGPVADERVTA